MKFIIDAQLPRRLAHWLTDCGHDCVHTRDLPGQNRTSDRDILLIAQQEDRVVITKDTDFQMSFELGLGPPKLLLITTGNLPNDPLIALFDRHHARIIDLLQTNRFLELSLGALIVHA